MTKVFDEFVLFYPQVHCEMIKWKHTNQEKNIKMNHESYWIAYCLIFSVAVVREYLASNYRTLMFLLIQN